MWANWARVTRSPHEFTLDFVRIDYADDPPRRAVLVARVAFSATLLMSLATILGEAWRSYAAKALPKEVEGDDGAEES